MQACSYVQIVRTLGKTREMKGFPRLAAGVLSTT
jgi:hypothetical protein